MYKNFLLALFLVASGILNCGMWAQGINTHQSADTLPNAPSAIEAQSQERAISRPVKPSDQDASGLLVPGTDPENHLMLPFIDHLVQDQRSFWLAPMHFHKQDLEWIVPFAGVTTGFVEGDSWISKQIPVGEINRSKTFSNYATYSLIGAGAGSFLLGHIKNDDQMSEAGLLSGEAAINATAISYLLKDATQRQRPYSANGSGQFFQSGDSFPSEHAAIAWSIASVMAHEYPGTLTKVLAYGLAAGISATRVTGQQHFPSDVIVGSALGWYFGRQVYRAHHDSDLGGSSWGSVLPEKSGDETRNPENMGSSNVPLDSWIYPAMERLIALGYIKSGYLGIRPWTRLECARLLEEAQQQIEDAGEQGGEAVRISNDLANELSFETGRLNGAANVGMSLDSVYARTTQISGTPLRDGYHFGQTIINDYGRPYGQGFNAVGGLTAHAEAGPLSISLQGEYQHAPAVASDSLSVLQATAAIDSTLPLANGTAQLNRFRLLDSTVALTFHNTEVSFGQQSLWLGTSEAGPFLFSDNAEPMTMLRIDSVSPYEVPLISKFLGPMRSQFFIGRLSGQNWEFSPALYGPNLSSQPFVHGTKFSFHPTDNLEFGIGFTAQFGGTGNPFTWGNFAKTFYSHQNTIAGNPGKRLSEFDFNYRVPGLRNWLQVYADSMVIDEYSPLISNRPAINPGIYFSHVPKIQKLDLRLEGITDDMNVPAHFGPAAFYWDERYHSGYTNNGNLIGSWIGRRGRGEQGWITYRFSPRSNIQFGYRHNSVDRAFLQGGTLQDFNLRTDLMLTHTLGISGFIQRETWNFPVLSPTAQSDTTASIQLTFWPHWNTSARNNQ
ncbi:MAG TPA: capsule assembly Wzi family protein [Terriglobales bacterium]|nr:capsule assembly Wzi family protein [Terriglobales bacterium]